MIYPAKRSQGLRPTTSETPLSVQEEEKDTIVHHLSTPRGLKKIPEISTKRTKEITEISTKRR